MRDRSQRERRIERDRKRRRAKVAALFPIFLLLVSMATRRQIRCLPELGGYYNCIINDNLDVAKKFLNAIRIERELFIVLLDR